MLRNKKCPDCRRDFTGTQKPNRILVNMAKEVTVKCDSCGWEGTRESSSKHQCRRAGGTEHEHFEAWTPPSRQEAMAAAGYSNTAGGGGGGGGGQQANSQESKLKEGWNEAVDRSSGRTYYVNHMSRQTTWTPPIDPASMNHVQGGVGGALPHGWEQKVDPASNMVYYVDHVNKRTSWVRP